MNSTSVREAIAFLDGSIVVKEMLYAEFEAVLDRVVGIPEFSKQQSHAVYLQIDGSLNILAAVFFLIDFDKKGNADGAWNIPLQHLSTQAGSGPDLGGGPIKLACRSQCSVAWHQRSLWDPDLSDGDSNTLNILAKRIKNNRLGLVVEEPTSPPAATVAEASRNPEKPTQAQTVPDISPDISRQLALLKEEHKLRISAMKSEAQQHLEKIRRQYHGENNRLQDALATSKQLFTEEKHRNIQLKKTLKDQSNELTEVRADFQQQIESSKDVEQGYLLALEEKFELELTSKLEAAKTELKEMLDMREVELFYRDEQIKRLNAEISQLRQERRQLIDASGGHVLQRLVDSGVTFVAYQPGIEHITIPVNEVDQYLEGPLNYVAQKCSVDSKLYDLWANHYVLPVCSHIDDQGNRCGQPVARVDKPSEFIIGESDRCAAHIQNNSTLSAAIKA